MVKRRHRGWHASHVWLDDGVRPHSRPLWIISEPPTRDRSRVRPRSRYHQLAWWFATPDAECPVSSAMLLDPFVSTHRRLTDEVLPLTHLSLELLTHELIESLAVLIVPCSCLWCEPEPLDVLIVRCYSPWRESEPLASAGLMLCRQRTFFFVVDETSPRTDSPRWALNAGDPPSLALRDTPGSDPSPDDLVGGRLHASLTRGGSRRRRRAEGSLLMPHNHDPLVRERRPKRRLRASSCRTPHPTPTIRIRPPAVRSAGPCTGHGVAMSLPG
jgi:hypothetical protein